MTISLANNAVGMLDSSTFMGTLNGTSISSVGTGHRHLQYDRPVRRGNGDRYRHPVGNDDLRYRQFVEYYALVARDRERSETLTASSPQSLTVNAVDGVATFTNLFITTTGTYELAATSPGLTTGDSTSITITANTNTPSQLVWVTQPGSEQTESFPFGAALELEDQYGNPESNQDIAISLDLDGSPDTNVGDLSGTDTAVHGVKRRGDFFQHHH